MIACTSIITYVVNENDNLTADEFRDRFGEDPSREKLGILVQKADDVADQVFIFFPSDDKV